MAYRSGFVGGNSRLNSIFLGYSVVLDGFTYDDIVKIAKDFDIPLDLLKEFQKLSYSSEEFEAHLRPLLSTLRGGYRFVEG